MPAGNGRHFGMDWLRIGAFQLLILYHIGMAFVPWPYEVKLADPPLDWATIPMFATNPWRLSLLFVVSGYASAALYRRNAAGIGRFVRRRMSRLGLPLLFGMLVIVTPQPWVNLVAQHGYGHGFLYFMTHDYFSFHAIDGVIVPTWMHLWFVAYLMAYTVLLAILLALPQKVRDLARRGAEAVLSPYTILPVGIALIFAARAALPPGWTETHAFAGDWSAHACYLFAFLFGYALRGSERLHHAIAANWRIAAALAILGWLTLAAIEYAYPGNTPAPRATMHIFQVARAVESWAAIVALISIADRYWNVDHPLRPMLAEAVFPFYIIHQTIIVVVGYWLLASGLGLSARFLILLVATIGGCWLFYLAGRSTGWLRPWIGLSYRKPKIAGPRVGGAKPA